LLIKQCQKIMNYLQRAGEHENRARVGLIMLEHIYYKNDSLYERTKKSLENKPALLEQIYIPEEASEKVIQSLVDMILQNCQQKFRIKAICMQLYHLAIHNKFFEAKDLALKAKLALIIQKQKIINQIYYNRAIVQIGLAAFRLGMFEESNNVLISICQSPNLKESLAQGVSNYLRQQDKTLEEEVEEKKRFMPPHLHISIETLDCVYLITSMLQEIPNLALNKFSVQKKVLNKNFRKLIEQYDLKGIQFLPQNSRDFIVFASRNLHQSRWSQCLDCVSQIKVFQRMPEFQNGSLKALLAQKIKETSLLIFFVASQTQYLSFSIQNLQEQFGLSKGQVCKIGSKLISTKEIHAKIDPKQGLIVYKRDSTQAHVGTLPVNDKKEIEHLQSMHLDKIELIVEGNERCMELYQSSNLQLKV